MFSETSYSQYKKNSLINIAGIVLGFGLVLLRTTLPGLAIEIALFVLSLIILVRAADVFTDMAVIVGERLGLSKLNTGILIIAIRTSAPELFSSISAALQNQPEMVVGNVIGTVIANCLLGVGIAAVVSKNALEVHREVLSTQMTIFLAAILLTTVGLYDGVLDRLEGLVLLIVLGFYLRYNIVHANSDTIELPDEMHEPKKDKQPMSLLIVLLVVNLVCLFLSGDFVVSSLSNGAELLGLSSAKLATSLLAIGTSIPEIATAIMLVRKNNTDSLFGEIIGSNIFDYLGIFGVIALVKPIVMSGALLNYLLIFAVGTYALLYVVMNDRKIQNVEGIALLALFAGFLIQLTNI
jgi:cation:H+ antiporter